MSNGVWTNNWRALKNTMLLGSFKPGLNTLTTTAGSTVAARSPDVPLRPISPMTAYAASPSYGYYNFLRVGTGSAPPAATDYALTEPDAISYLSAANDALVYDLGEGTAEKTVKLVVQNVGSAAVTLREWGILSRIGYGTASNTYAGDFLLYRGTFDSPVTLDTYQSATLTLTLTLTLSDPL